MQTEQLSQPPDLQRFYVDVHFAEVFISLVNQKRRARLMVDEENDRTLEQEEFTIRCARIAAFQNRL